MRVTVGSGVDTLVLHDMTHRQEGGLWLTDQGIQGWWGAVKPREEGVPIPQQDGCYMPARLTSGGRTVTVNGACVASSSVDMGVLRDRINDLMNRPLTLMVSDSMGERHAACWLADDPEPGMWVGEQVFTFTLVLFCPDPLKYGREVSFAPSLPWLEVENAGLAASWPRVRVDGPVSMLRVRCDEGMVEWHGDAAGLDLDFADMQPSSGRVTIGRPWRVRPGTGRYWVDMDGAGDMRMIVRPAWR